MSVPWPLAPQLAAPADEVPSGDGWLHELKHDGYRLLARVQGRAVELRTRGGHVWTDRLSPVAEELGGLGLADAILDGELVALDPDGRSEFGALQKALGAGDGRRLHYYLFDLPWDGEDLRRAPLIERKARLAERLGDRIGRVRYSRHLVGRGRDVYEQACELAAEGIISKRVDAPYVSGRGRGWLKVKCHYQEEFVVGGYTLRGGRVASLLLGRYEDDQLVYEGRVGTGFSDEDRLALRARLGERPRPTFTPPPPADPEVRWVEPALVVAVRFGDWTDGGHLRHAAFQGVREDKRAREVRRLAQRTPKRPMARAGRPLRTLEVAGVPLTSPDKVLYPDAGVTKADLAAWYLRVAGRMLPHVANRPLSLLRCPEGRGDCFFQKHPGEGLPAPIRRIEVPAKRGTKVGLAIDDEAGLVALVQLGVLEIHPWGARADRPLRPERLVLDLDPGPGVAWPAVVAAAREARERLAALGLRSFVLATGGKGLHVVAPLARRHHWDTVKSFAHDLAAAMRRDAPDRYTEVSSKAKRAGRIFVDYLRNGRGHTAVAPWSTRARPGAPVAVPVAWDDLDALAGPDAFRVSRPPAWLDADHDPWPGYFDLRQSISKEARAAVSRRLR